MRTQIKDLSVGKYEGDLKYGRANGSNPDKGKDYAAERNADGTPQNRAIAPLVLVQKRDPQVWKKDPNVKQAKKALDNSQHGVNYLIQSYSAMNEYMRANIHLTIGRSKM